VVESLVDEAVPGAVGKDVVAANDQNVLRERPRTQ
jgi:hypothetical protein